MKRFLSLLFLLIALLPSTPGHAYRLPAYRIADGDRTAPAEDVLARLTAELRDMGPGVRLSRLEEHRRNPKVHLNPAERRATDRYETLVVAADFWRHVVDLKASLADLHKPSPPPQAIAEADVIAKTIIERIYTLSDEYRVVLSPLFQNFLINAGIKKKGFCYHYVDALRTSLSSQPWAMFDIRWGEAWAGTFRENNALVITARGASFESGIAIDAWRTGGRPFWTPIAGDRFPWTEAVGIAIE